MLGVLQSSLSHSYETVKLGLQLYRPGSTVHATWFKWPFKRNLPPVRKQVGIRGLQNGREGMASQAHFLSSYSFIIHSEMGPREWKPQSLLQGGSYSNREPFAVSLLWVLSRSTCHAGSGDA
ncbi:Hypothetical protein NTJ_14067 [Nesidiocoris tenuis]|uniref:Uncharacterized protein n=1 Tax=Nesidiocoris tenuis TaxID=355587 RepID=A0ABN7BDI6_9HEMI|nr:Hypothetical protein NTJ_14067 [Nesidiocoris tenuis]